MYSKVPPIRPPILIVGSSHNSEQVSVIRKMHFGCDTSGLNSEGGLNVVVLIAGFY